MPDLARRSNPPQSAGRNGEDRAGGNGAMALNLDGLASSASASKVVERKVKGLPHLDDLGCQVSRLGARPAGYRVRHGR